jgi:hypothetical protein
MLPQSSVAFHVRVTIRVVGHGPPLVLSVKVIVGLVSQMSVAVALPVALGSVEPLQLVLKSGGQKITGGVVSRTVISCAQVRVFPAQSVAFHVRVIRRIMGQFAVLLVLSVKLIAGEGLQLSVPVATPVDAGLTSLPHSTATSGGQVTVG